MLFLSSSLLMGRVHFEGKDADVCLAMCALLMKGNKSSRERDQQGAKRDLPPELMIDSFGQNDRLETISTIAKEKETNSSSFYLSCVSPLRTVALVNDHEDEYKPEEMILPVFLKSRSSFTTSPIFTVNGTKRLSVEPRLNVLSSLDTKESFTDKNTLIARVLIERHRDRAKSSDQSQCHCSTRLQEIRTGLELDLIVID